MGSKIDVDNTSYKKFKMKNLQEAMMLQDGTTELAEIVNSAPRLIFLL